MQSDISDILVTNTGYVLFAELPTFVVYLREVSKSLYVVTSFDYKATLLFNGVC